MLSLWQQAICTWFPSHSGVNHFQHASPAVFHNMYWIPFTVSLTAAPRGIVFFYSFGTALHSSHISEYRNPVEIYDGRSQIYILLLSVKINISFITSSFYILSPASHFCASWISPALKYIIDTATFIAWRHIFSWRPEGIFFCTSHHPSMSLYAI